MDLDLGFWMRFMLRSGVRIYHIDVDCSLLPFLRVVHLLFSPLQKRFPQLVGHSVDGDLIEDLKHRLTLFPLKNMSKLCT